MLIIGNGVVVVDADDVIVEFDVIVACVIVVEFGITKNFQQHNKNRFRFLVEGYS